MHKSTPGATLNDFDEFIYWLGIRHGKMDQLDPGCYYNYDTLNSHCSQHVPSHPGLQVHPQ
jgi:hypothetical protein